MSGHLARLWDHDLTYSFRRSPVTVAAAAMVALLALTALFAPLIAPMDPFDPAGFDLLDGLTPPGTPNEFTGRTYLLGADNQGRDMFSAIVYGLRVSLAVGVAAVALAIVIGVAMGLIAGYCGGAVDAIVMRIADVQLTFPPILVALLIFGFARGLVPPAERDAIALYVLIASIGLSEWVQYARTVRGVTMVERRKEYVEAARLIGAPAHRIMLRHILPNCAGSILVIATIGLAIAIITEATLSFLGVGLPPTQPSLGTLIRIGQDFLFSGQWWIALFPAATLIALSLSVNLLGDWLRDALNPKLR